MSTQFEVPSTVVEDLLEIFTKGFLRFVENAIGPTGDTGRIILIRIKLILVSWVKVERSFLEISHDFTVFLSKRRKLLVFVQLFIVL